MHDYDKLVVIDLEEIIAIIQKECNHSDYTEALQYSIRCVNQHDSLVAKVERLKEALRKCEPFNEEGICKFCDYAAEWNHYDECEFLAWTSK